MQPATLTPRHRSQRFQMSCAEFTKLVVVRLTGQIGAADVDNLRLRLKVAMLRRPTHVIVDMSELDFLGSLAVGALLEFRMDVLRHQGTIMLAAVPPAVMTLLHASRLDELFIIKDNVADALTI